MCNEKNSIFFLTIQKRQQSSCRKPEAFSYVIMQPIGLIGNFLMQIMIEKKIVKEKDRKHTHTDCLHKVTEKRGTKLERPSLQSHKLHFFFGLCCQLSLLKNSITLIWHAKNGDYCTMLYRAPAPNLLLYTHNLYTLHTLKATTF